MVIFYTWLLDQVWMHFISPVCICEITAADPVERFSMAFFITKLIMATVSINRYSKEDKNILRQILGN